MAALITIEDIERYLKTSIDTSPSDENTDYDLYVWLITAISDQIERVTGVTFASTSYVDRVDGNGENDLILPHYPIISLSDVSYIDIKENTTTIDTEYVIIDYDSGTLYKNSVWVAGRHNIQVTYQAGYITIPEDLQLLVIEMVVEAFNTTERELGVIQEKLGDYEYKLGSVSEVVKAKLSRLSPWIEMVGNSETI